MAFLNLHLACLAMLMLALHLEFASAAIHVSSIRAKDLSGDAFGNKPDPYVKVWCGSTFGGMTEYYTGTSSPVWSAEFTFRNGKIGNTLKLEVWDKDMLVDNRLATCSREAVKGTNKVTCNLSKGTLYFTYEVYLIFSEIASIATSSGVIK